MRLRLFIVIDVEVPRVDVRIDMPVGGQVLPYDDAHVLDEPGAIESFRDFPHSVDPLEGGLVREFLLPRFRRRLPRLRADPFHQLGLAAEAPSLIEETPRDNRGMIEVPLNSEAHHFLEAFP